MLTPKEIHDIVTNLINVAITTGGILLIIRYVGKSVIRQIFADIIGEEYDEKISPKVKKDIKTSLEEKIATELKLHKEATQRSLEKTLECKFEKLEERFITRAEFKIYMENSNKTLEEVKSMLERVLIKLANL